MWNAAQAKRAAFPHVIPDLSGPSSGLPRASSAIASTPPRRRIGLQGDRKSTRLNSSHVSISYAVFCLKKKKKTMNFRTLYVEFKKFFPLLYTPTDSPFL